MADDPQSPLIALKRALQALRAKPGSEAAYEDAQKAIQQLFIKDPEALALPDGTSILSACAKAYPTLAYQWWLLRGEEVWASTPSTLNPLIEMLFGHDTINPQWSNTFFDVDPDLLLDFIREGMERRMPLTNAQARTWKEGEKLTNEQVAQIKDQAKLVRFCLNGRMDDAKGKMGLLKSLDGALPQSEFGAGDYARLHEGLIAATEPLLNPRATIGATKSRFAPWWEHWRDERGYFDLTESEKILSHLQAHNISTGNLEAQVLSYRMEERVECFVEKKYDPSLIWSYVKKEGERSNGRMWQYEDDGHKLLWHGALCSCPALINEALANPPEHDPELKQISSKGYGLWDAIVDSYWSDKHVPTTSIEALAQILPPTLCIMQPGSTDLCWARPDLVSKLMRDGGLQKITLKLGGENVQRSAFNYMMAGLCSHQPMLRMKSAAQVDFLADEHMDNSQFGTGIRLGMSLLQSLATQQPAQFGWILKEAPNLKRALPFDIPDSIDKPWMESVAKTLSKRDGSSADYANNKSILMSHVAQRVLGMKTAPTLATPEVSAPTRRL